MTCPKQASFCLLTVARRSSCGPKEVDLAPHPVVGLVLQVGDTEKFSQALDFEGLDIIFRVSKQDPCFTAIEEDGDDKTLVQLRTFFAKLMGIKIL